MSLTSPRIFGYDAAGNLTKLIDRNSRVTEYVYDNQHRRVAEKWKDGSTVLREISFSYGAAGQLIAASDPDSEYAYT